MNILLKIEDNAADDSLQKLIDRRIKEILHNDKYIQGRIDTLLEVHIDKRAQQYLDKYFNQGDFITAIVKKLKDKAGISDDYICRIAYKEIVSQVTQLVTNNEAVIKDLFKDDTNTSESEG